MSNINLNLSTSAESSDSGYEGLGSGIIFSFLVLILVMATYGVLVYFNRDLSSKIQAVESQYKSEYDKFLTGNANAVLDFENRRVVAGDLMEQDRSMNEFLQEIENRLLPAVYLESYEYDRDKKSLNLFCVGDNFNTIARQILNFKESNYFLSVIPGSSAVNPQTNQLNFSLELKIK